VGSPFLLNGYSITVPRPAIMRFRPIASSTLPLGWPSIHLFLLHITAGGSRTALIMYVIQGLTMQLMAVLTAEYYVFRKLLTTLTAMKPMFRLLGKILIFPMVKLLFEWTIPSYLKKHPHLPFSRCLSVSSCE